MRWALEEAWLPCQARLVDFDDLNLDAYRKKQPFGMVPAFEADGLDLSSGAIVHHIATACEALMSTDGAGRAATLTWKGKDGDYRREIPPQPRDGSAVGGSLGWRGTHRRTDGTALRGSFDVTQRAARLLSESNRRSYLFRCQTAARCTVSVDWVA